ncbi:MAG: hypothetical protein AMXMBFR33_14020 [Candidatus Xenobia bacterium]
MSWNSGFQLRVIGGSERDRVIPLLSKEIILGRAANARVPSKEGQVFFTDPTVSRTHCTLRWDHRRKCYLLTHLSRTNSTKVDDERVTQAPLTVGTKIQMGHVLLVLESSAGTRLPESEPAEVISQGGWEIPLDPVLPSQESAPDFEPEPSFEFELLPPPIAPPPELPTMPPPPERQLERLVERPSQLPANIPPIPKVTPPKPPPPRRRSVPLSAPSEAAPVEARPSRAGWRMQVLEGPDKGAVMPLNAAEMLLGRSMGLADPRFGHAVLIGDSSLPYEQALLRWEEEQGSYVIEVNAQGLPVTIHRATGQDLSLDPGDSMMLQIGDRVAVGKSVLELEQVKRRG